MIFRLGLSLTLLLILGMGSYQAFKYFTGADPLQFDPKEAARKYLTKDELLKLSSGIIDGSAFLDKSDKTDNSNEIDLSKEEKPLEIISPVGPIKFKFAVVADSHSDNENLTKALSFAKSLGAVFVVGLGDWSTVGTMDELTQAKKIFQGSGLPYYTTAGDHDLWDARDKGKAASSSFSQVFGSSYSTFLYKDIRFVLVYNADNEEGLDSVQWSWLEGTLHPAQLDQGKPTFVFLHIPVYHPTSDRYMGSSKKTGDKGENQTLLSQAGKLMSLLKEGGVLEVFAGDIHAYSRYEDPKYNLKMTTVGALTRDRNTQAPRFAMVDVYESGQYNIEDLEIR